MANDENDTSPGHDSDGVNMGQMDAKSVAGSQVSSVGLSMKAHRVLKIKRLEQELMKLQRKFEILTDPELLSNKK